MKNVLKNWKTTLFGVLILIIGGYSAFHNNNDLTQWALTLLGTLLGVFAKDGNVTGRFTTANEEESSGK